jgi:pimeloyl-ACP methyl ester carboxylesterase
MVEDRYIERRGMIFHYRDWGGHGKPMVLLHGLASQSHIFDLVAPRLAQNYRVVALDQRGHGASAKPDSGYDFKSVMDDLLAFLVAMKFKRAIFVGHSWGGNVALQFAATYPERVTALVLIDGGFLDIQANPEMTWERTRELLAPPKLAGTPVKEFKKMLKKFMGDLWKPATERVILANLEILPNQTIRPHLSYENHMRILRALWEQRPTKFYARVQCPVLMLPALNHTNDPREIKMQAAKREEIARAEDLMQKCETVWFEQTGHDIPLQRPLKLANAITRFLRKYLRR